MATFIEKVLELIGSSKSKRKRYRLGAITQMIRTIEQNDFREDYTIIFWRKAQGVQERLSLA